MFLGACIGALLSVDIHEGQDPPPAPDYVDPLSVPEISVEYLKGRVRVTGSSASRQHEEVLRQVTSEQFAGRPARFEFRPSVLTNTDWASTSARLLYLLAALDTAVATLRPEFVSVRGLTSRPEVYQSRLNFLREQLPPGMSLSTDVITLQSGASLDELCVQAFDSLFLQPVTFHESGAEIRDASRVTLDRVTDFARDCQSVSIEIRGHSDASGDESWNKRLSLARARAVADRMAANGIDPQRLIVVGVGSAEPVADNATARGREANRRIEFRLRQSSVTLSGDSSPSSSISNISVAPGGMTLPAPRSP